VACALTGSVCVGRLGFPSFDNFRAGPSSQSAHFRASQRQDHCFVIGLFVLDGACSKGFWSRVWRLGMFLQKLLVDHVSAPQCKWGSSSRIASAARERSGTFGCSVMRKDAHRPLGKKTKHSACRNDLSGAISRLLRSLPTAASNPRECTVSLRVTRAKALQLSATLRHTIIQNMSEVLTPAILILVFPILSSDSALFWTRTRIGRFLL